MCLAHPHHDSESKKEVKKENIFEKILSLVLLPFPTGMPFILPSVVKSIQVLSNIQESDRIYLQEITNNDTQILNRQKRMAPLAAAAVRFFGVISAFTFGTVVYELNFRDDVDNSLRAKL